MVVSHSCALHFMEVVTGWRFGQKLKLTARKKKLALSISGSISWNWCPCESYHLRMPKWPGQFQTVNLSFLVFGYQQRLHCQSMMESCHEINMLWLNSTWNRAMVSLRYVSFQYQYISIQCLWLCTICKRVAYAKELHTSICSKMKIWYLWSDIVLPL